ncbi:MAG: hypothetical protein KDD53_11280, partial [Bdellovibrionales bacterium]|nr:hypothetical protein [Bdellovibrionales bacterium]
LKLKYSSKVILHSVSGYTRELDSLVEDFIRDGVKFVGVVGVDCAKLEDIIDEIVVGDGTRNYNLLTSSHPNESLQQAISFAESLTDEFAGPVQVVEI